MGKSSDIYGISKVEYGDPGDGILGGSLVEYTDIAENTVNVNITAPDLEKIYTETNRKTPYRSFSGGEQTIQFIFGLFGVIMASWHLFLGGSYAAGPPEKWSSPTTTQDIYKSVVLTQRDTDTGKRLLWKMPYGFITAGVEGSLTYNNVADIRVTAEANLPVSSTGVEGDPVYVELDTD